MRPEDVQDLIAKLPSLSAEGWLYDLMARNDAHPPLLLPFLGELPAHVSDAAALLKAPLLILKELSDELDAQGQPRPWVERPLRQVQRVVLALLAGHDLHTNTPPQQLGIGPDTAPLTVGAQQHLAQASGIAARWLQAAVRSGAAPDLRAADPAARSPWHGWLPPGAGAACTLPVVLVNEVLQQGVQAELSLRLVQEPGARLCLVSAPASSLLLRVGTEWDETLASLREQLLAELRDHGHGPWPLQDTAIAWDLHRRDGQLLHTLEGPSAGASLALGALWLLRRAAPPAWQHELMALEPRHLRRCAFTAALGPRWQMLPVGGLGEKCQALLPLAHAIAAQAGRADQLGTESTLALGVSALQDLPVDATVPAPGRVPIQPYPDLLAAAQHLARQADRLSPAQQQLWDLLVVPGEAPLNPSPSPGLLKQVAAEPARSLRQYLLRCWAQCGRAMHPSLQQRFVALDLVPLEVKPDAHGPHRPLLGDKAALYTSLHELLLKRDGTLAEDGYLLRGMPGAGKSTLLRHHLQRAARRLLQWHAGSFVPTPLDAGQPPPHELPVYLALNSLDATVTEAQLPGCLRDQLSHNQPPELLQLLAGQGSWAHERGLKPRLLLDGLNELRVAQAGQRPQRAAQVVGALRQLMRDHTGLPMLLSIRPQHAVALQDFRVLRVDVQDWTDSHIQTYLEHCFPGEAQQRFQALAAEKHALSLCRRPQQLAAQCELMADGLKALPGDRAALFNAWLWQRLRRALGRPSRHEEARKADDVWDESALGLGHPDEVLLTSADRAAIADDERWQQQGAPSVMTLQGQLVRSLARQALAQWNADALGGAAGSDRTAGEQGFDSVAPWLRRDTDAALAHPEDGLRLRFARAARALGVVRVDDAYRTWEFDHQAWGEFLASCALLADGPPASATLLQRLRLPALPLHSDEAEIEALAQAGSSAWQAVPDAVWAALLNEGLRVPWHDFIGSIYGPPHDAQHLERLSLQVLHDARAYFDNNTLRDITEDGQRWCQANLRLWGDNFSVSAALDLDQDDAWRNPQKAGPAGWQFLALQRLTPVFLGALWTALHPHLGDQALAALQAQKGRLEEPPAADGAEVLGLALLGLPRAQLQAWLQALLAAEGPAAALTTAMGQVQAQALGPLWPALAGVLPELQARLEPDGAWGERAAATQAPALQPDARLQHLRRVLLLHSLDAGAASLAGVRASGMLALLDAPPAVPLPAELQAAWQRWREAAFQGEGQRLRLRLQAGLLLGALGDNIRYQFVRPTAPGASPGLRPHPQLWAQVGPSGRWRRGRFRIGGGQHADEQPAWTARLPGFLACRLPLTVGEWHWFQRSPQGQHWEWTQAGNADFNNPLQPITGISWRALRAYAEWADALWREGPTQAGQEPPRGHLALPTEVQWEAAARGPLPSLPSLLARLLQRLRVGLTHRSAPVAKVAPPPAATLFNHASTRWARPSPVGCFSRCITALGLADTLGNVWEFCANALPDEQRQRGWQQEADRVAANRPAQEGNPGDRALRGGAFNRAKARCRASCRLGYHLDYLSGSFGARLVRVWPPHSEP